jgi:hypothetical protein
MAAAVAIAGAHNLRPVVPSPLMGGARGLGLPNKGAALRDTEDGSG